jgi:hypothetical protein
MKSINENILNEEVMAAISAAVASMNTRTGYKLVVKSFRRIPQISPIWNSTGRIERIQGRLS